MTDLTLAVMAAGIGSRFGGLKQLAPIGPNGEVTISYSIHDALRAGIRSIVFVIRKDMEAEFRERIGRFAEARADTKYVHQSVTHLPQGFRPPAGRERPWGTGHAVLCCKGTVTTPFLVINADDLYGPTAYRLLGQYLRVVRSEAGISHYCMPGYPVRNTLSPHGHVARGVCRVSSDDFMLDVVERTRIQDFDGTIRYADDNGRWVDLPPDTIVSMNMWGLTPDVFDELERRFAAFLEKRGGDLKAEYFLPTIIGQLVAERKATVKVLRTGDPWYGVTYREDLVSVRGAVQDMIRRGVYPDKL
jgi:dTDP-glucose pyrophosphorylase